MFQGQFGQKKKKNKPEAREKPERSQDSLWIRVDLEMPEKKCPEAKVREESDGRRASEVDG